MSRPEIPVSGNGPVADLARELRRLRDLAGRPGYRQLAQQAHFGSTTLAGAASGYARPSKAVAIAFAQACGAADEDLARIADLWEKADRAQRATRRTRDELLIGREVGTRRLQEQGLRRAASGRSVSEPPLPDEDGTAESYVRSLRALRAWAGQPGYKGIVKNAETALQRSPMPPVPRSTMYDAFNPKRTALPALDVVRYIVAGLAPAALGEWTSAWRAVKLREVLSSYDDPVRVRLLSVATADQNGQNRQPDDTILIANLGLTDTLPR